MIVHSNNWDSRIFMSVWLDVDSNTKKERQKVLDEH